jgi:hypothetical protein
MKTWWGNKGTDPRILNHSPRWNREVSFTPQPLYLLGKRTSAIYWTGCGMGFRAHVDTVASRKNPNHWRESNSGRPAYLENPKIRTYFFNKFFVKRIGVNTVYLAIVRLNLVISILFGYLKFMITKKYFRSVAKYKCLGNAVTDQNGSQE